VTVQRLTLSGLDAPDALAAAAALLADRSVRDLTQLLVIDDTGMLTEHQAAYEALLTSGQLTRLLCVAIGGGGGGRPRTEIDLPGNISSRMGSGVLWVGDPLGIDLELTADAVAMKRPVGVRTGLLDLLEILDSDDVYLQVRELVSNMRDGVVNPGLRLADAGDRDIAFPAALARAIRQLTKDDQSAEAEPIVGLRDIFASPPRLVDDSELARSAAACAAHARQAAGEMASQGFFSRLFGIGQPARDVLAQVTDAGQELAQLRGQVAGLLKDANATGGLTEKQEELLADNGVVLSRVGAWDDRSPGSRPGTPAGVVRKAVADRIRAGDPLPLVIRRLAAAETALTSRGSLAYLPEIDRRCPPELVSTLQNPPPVPRPQWWLPLTAAAIGVVAGLGALVGAAVGVVVTLAWDGVIAASAGERRGAEAGTDRAALASNLVAGLAGTAAGVAVGEAIKPRPAIAVAFGVLAVILGIVAAAMGWRARATAWDEKLQPTQASAAAQGLTDLVIEVASKEWSAGAAVLEAVARARIIVQGSCDQLREYAENVESSTKRGRQEPRVASLGRILLPTLREVPIYLLEAQPAAGVPDGQASYREAKGKTGNLIQRWAQAASESGPLVRPPFAVLDEQASADIGEEELDATKVAAGYDPHRTMCQLCEAGDLAMLDMTGDVEVVPFAPYAARRSLLHVLPDRTVWSRSWHRAGVLRLVPLRANVQVVWTSEKTGRS
jgi:uncharacterized membrane protein HdeD (DUF308 family)